jgi:uncharacterized membrane protein YphA (DoxX/SURF4 family)
MNDIASVIILLLLTITFIQSGFDKIFEWNRNVEWLKGHFSKVILLKNQVPLALFTLLILELISGVLSFIGAISLIINADKTVGYFGAVVSSITLLFLLLGQRLAKDYDGARTIVIYLIPAILAVFWLK